MSGADATISRREQHKKSNQYAKFGLRTSTSSEPVGRTTPNTMAKFPHAHENNAFQLNPELKENFARNFRFFRRVFSIETILSPLPAPMSRGIARSIHSFTRIFTQFFDQEGIANAQRSLGLADAPAKKKKIRKRK